MAELIGVAPHDDAAIDAFWHEVEQNLRSGHVRLIFVADEIPRELRRIIEFLNQHMPAVEVLGVEIVRYVREGVEAFVPRVVGQSEVARQAREGRRTTTTPAEFLASCTPHARPLFERILAEAPLNGAKVVWGTKGFSVRAGPAGRISLFYGYPPATIQAYVGHLAEQARPAARTAFLAAAPFREAGQFTLDHQVTDSASAAQRAVDELWRQTRALSEPQADQP